MQIRTQFINVCLFLKMISILGLRPHPNTMAGALPVTPRKGQNQTYFIKGIVSRDF
jgi:hypothetical protein